VLTVAYQLFAFLRRDWRIVRASAFGLAWQATAIIFVTPTLYYMGRLVRPGTPTLAAYGGDYFTFAVIGIACSGFFAAVMGACAAAARQEQVGGTLEVLLTTPVRLPVLAAGASFLPVMLAAAQSLLYIVLGGAMFHVDFGHANVAGAVLIIALAMLLSGAFGLFAAAFVILFRRGDPFTGIMVGIGAMLGGVFYPTEVLPPAARTLAEFVPLTPALRGVRLAMMNGGTLPALASSLGPLAAWCAIAVPLSLLAAGAALSEAKRSGTASGYG
jgi:ABC-2 type transport system permease protein